MCVFGHLANVFTRRLTTAIAMKNITETMCGKPVRDRTHVIAYSGIGGMAVAIAAYLVRIFSKIHMPSQGLTFFTELWWDDFVMTIGMMFLIPLCSISVPSKPLQHS